MTSKTSKTSKAPVKTGSDIIRERVALGETVTGLADLSTVTGDLTPDQAVEYGVSIGGRKRDADRQYGTAMLDAARMWARVQPHIGEGKVFRDQGDYVSALGFSKGYGTRIRRLSVAVESYGFAPDSPQWTRLSQDTSSALGELLDARLTGKGGSPSKAQRDRLTKYLTSDKPAGKVKTPKATPPKTPKATPPVPSTVQDLAAFLRAFTPALHEMSDAQAVRVERALIKFAQENKTRRETLARKAAKVA